MATRAFDVVGAGSAGVGCGGDVSDCCAVVVGEDGEDDADDDVGVVGADVAAWSVVDD